MTRKTARYFPDVSREKLRNFRIIKEHLHLLLGREIETDDVILWSTSARCHLRGALSTCITM